jgi:hypothetical protein
MPATTVAVRGKSGHGAARQVANAASANPAAAMPVHSIAARATGRPGNRAASANAAAAMHAGGHTGGSVVRAKYAIIPAAMNTGRNNTNRPRSAAARRDTRCASFWAGCTTWDYIKRTITGRKHFFFEKKKQKTFVPTVKSFLVLFSKKNTFP